MEPFFAEGARVWLRENGQHYPSTVLSCAEGVIVFRTDYGQVYTYNQRSITHQKVTAMQPTSAEGLEDMAALADLHEGAIMHNLFQRHQQNKIYTYIGSIVASVNPYKIIPGLYDRTAVELYSRHHLGEISPHIFAVANECYRCLWKRPDNQCVLISIPLRSFNEDQIVSLALMFIGILSGATAVTLFMGIGVNLAPRFPRAFLSHADDIGSFVVPAQTV